MNLRTIKARFRAKRRASKARAADMLPVVTGPGPCRDCWTAAGEPHQMSCEQVSFEQAMAALGMPIGGAR